MQNNLVNKNNKIRISFNENNANIKDFFIEELLKYFGEYEIVDFNDDSYDILFTFLTKKTDNFAKAKTVIFASGESKENHKDEFPKYDFGMTFFGNTYNNLFLPYSHTSYTIGTYKSLYKHFNDKKDRFCSFCITNKSYGNLTGKRIELFEYISKSYKRIDSLGFSLNNVGYVLDRDPEIMGKELGHYKFSLCFENSKGYDGETYITEKIFNAFSVGSIPIFYYEGKLPDYIDSKSFINCYGLTNEEILEKIIEIDNNDNLYNEIISNNPFKNGININQYELGIKNLSKRILLDLKIKKGEEIIVLTMTSFPKRIKYCHDTIIRLLNNTKKADILILNLSSEEFPNKMKDLPDELVNLHNDGSIFINWIDGPNTKTLKKMVPSFKIFGNNAVYITVDDDILYTDDLIETLYNSYKTYNLPITAGEWHPFWNKEIYGHSGAFSITKPKFLGDSIFDMYEYHKEKRIYDLYPPHDDELYTLLTHENGFDYISIHKTKDWFENKALKTETSITQFSLDFSLLKEYVSLVKEKLNEKNYFEDNKKIDIFICCHQPFFNSIKSKSYSTISNSFSTKYTELNVPEVTNMQRSYGECSRMYWVWKKYPVNDYVGFCHYRRFFNFYEDIPNMDKLFKRYDAIVTKEDFYTYITVEKHFSSYNDLRFLYEWLNIINELYPEYTKGEIKRYLKCKMFCLRNMFILKKDDFYKYMEWCFSIAEEFNRRNNLKTQEDVINYCKKKCNEFGIPYQGHYDRLHGFLFEICQGLYFKHNFKHILGLPIKMVE